MEGFIMPARITVLATFCLALALGAASCGGDKTPSEPSCTYSVSSSTLAFTSAGGQGAAALSTGAGCAWTAVADSPWVSFPGGASGSGPATLAFAVATNGATDTRKATLSVAGQPLAITQDGRAPCEYSVTPSAVDIVAAGGQASVTITAGAGCQWTATTSDPWVTIAAGASGSGNGAVTLAVNANAATDERQTTIAVAGRPVTLRQAGAKPAPPPPCTYTVSPLTAVSHWHGMNFTVDVVTSAGCSWTATASEGWLFLTDAAGVGPGAISVSLGSFTEDATRRAAVQVRWPTETAGQNVWVTQEGCRYGVDPSASVAASGGTRMATVVMQPLSPACATGCPWTATSNVSWIKVTSSMPRAGDDAFFYQVDANIGGPRVGTITVAGRTHTVNQAGI